MNAATLIKLNINLQDATLLKTQCYVDGKWGNAASKKTFEVDNPATGAIIADVANGDAADTRMAIDAADRALPAWRARTPKDRAAIFA